VSPALEEPDEARSGFGCGAESTATQAGAPRARDGRQRGALRLGRLIQWSADRLLLLDPLERLPFQCAALQRPTLLAAALLLAPTQERSPRDAKIRRFFPQRRSFASSARRAVQLAGAGRSASVGGSAARHTCSKLPA
jgi:hypothetical protein